MFRYDSKTGNFIPPLSDYNTMSGIIFKGNFYMKWLQSS